MLLLLNDIIVDVYKRQLLQFFKGQRALLGFYQHDHGKVVLSVSYTHLDVYKRQKYSHPAIIIQIIFNESYVLSAT